MIAFPFTYPGELLDVLARGNVRIQQIPILNLEGRINDYINFLEPKDLSHSIMKFQDGIGRPGLAFKIRVIADKNFNTLPMLGKEFVLTVFKRYPPSHCQQIKDFDKVWVADCFDKVWVADCEDLLSNFAKDQDKEHFSQEHIQSSQSVNCPRCAETCPMIGSNVSLPFLAKLLSGKHLHFELPTDALRSSPQQHPAASLQAASLTNRVRPAIAIKALGTQAAAQPTTTSAVQTAAAARSNQTPHAPPRISDHRCRQLKNIAAVVVLALSLYVEYLAIPRLYRSMTIG